MQLTAAAIGLALLSWAALALYGLYRLLVGCR